MTFRLWWIHLKSMQIFFFEFQCCQSINSSRYHRNRLYFPGCLKVNMYLGFICFTVTLRRSSWDQNTFFFFFRCLYTKKWKSVPLRVYSLSMGFLNKIIFIAPFLAGIASKHYNVQKHSWVYQPGTHWCPFMDMPGHPPTLPPNCLLLKVVEAVCPRKQCNWTLGMISPSINAVFFLAPNS